MVAETREGMVRYHLLEVIRAYAAEKLEASGEAAAVRERHAVYLLDLAQSARDGMTGPAQAEWVRRLDLEHHNLRAALTWALAAGEGELALELCASLSRFWYIRGYFREGRDWSARALAAAPDALPSTRAAMLHGAAALAIQHDLVAARPLIEASVALWRADGSDRRGLARSLTLLAILARLGRDGATARAACEEALAIYAEAPDPWGQWLALGELGWVAEGQGDHTTARRLMEESLALARGSGTPIDNALQLNSLGTVAIRQGDAGGAMTRHREALLLTRELGAREVMAGALEGLAAVAAAREQYERAARLLGVATALRALIDSPPFAHYEVERRRIVPAVLRALGERAFAAAQAEGEAWPLEEAIAYALEEPVAGAVSDDEARGHAARASG
ncbi:MAG: hypothetical protein AB7R89_11210 [Dehalococcoidia bacterium]